MLVETRKTSDITGNCGKTVENTGKYFDLRVSAWKIPQKSFSVYSVKKPNAYIHE